MNKTKAALARVAFMISVFLTIFVGAGAFTQPTGPMGHELTLDPTMLAAGAVCFLITWASFMAVYLTRSR